MLKITTAKELARIERLSIEEGADDEAYMLQAGKGIYEIALKYITSCRLPKKVTLLVGKGNNGGDAFVVGCELLKSGFDVLALCLYKDKESSLLNQKFREVFLKKGGEIESVQQANELQLTGFLIDGLLGTGFSGKVEGLMADVIEKVNASNLPTLCIDIPSGLNGSTGEVESVAVFGKWTVCLGLPKLGLLIEQGIDRAGKLAFVDFGMETRYLLQAKSYGNLFEENEVQGLFPRIKRSQHKYEAGYVLAVAGSKEMPGAALLSTLAAFRSGAGIVRLFHDPSMHDELLGSFDELIKTPIHKNHYEPLYQEVKRAGSLLIGPGCGKAPKFKELLLDILSNVDLPTILDADALAIFAKHAKKYPSDVILTPHEGEMHQCLEAKNKLSDLELIKKTQDFANQKRVTIVLKGAPTWIFVSGKDPLAMMVGDPGMATAGSGDVLSGVIAALLSSGMSPENAAIAGVFLHGKAGEIAANRLDSHSLIASDIIDSIADVYREISHWI